MTFAEVPGAKAPGIPEVRGDELAAAESTVKLGVEMDGGASWAAHAGTMARRGGGLNAQ